MTKNTRATGRLLSVVSQGQSERASVSREIFRIKSLLGRAQTLLGKLERDEITEADRPEAEALLRECERKAER